MNNLYFEQVNKIQEIAEVLLVEIEKHFPGLTKKTFDSFGLPDREGRPALERAKFCIYVELMKAGAFNNELGLNES